MTKSVLFILFFLNVLIASAQDSKVDTVAGKVAPVVDKYDLLIMNAANAVANEDFEQAKALYNEALSIKPNDPVAGSMLITVNNSLKALEAIQRRKADLKRKDDINKLLSQAQAEVMARNYESAKVHYNQVLSLQPIASQEEFVKQRLRAIDYASDPSKKSGASNTTSSNNLLAINKVAGETHSPTTGVNEQKNANTTPTNKPITDAPKGVVKTEKDSFQAKAETTPRQTLNQSTVSGSEKRIVSSPAPNATATINKTAINEQSPRSLTNVSTSSVDTAKQGALQRQNDDLKKKAQENESKKMQPNSSVSLIASKNRIEPMKEGSTLPSTNSNTKSTDSSKQIALQKQNDEIKKKLQENESKKLPANTVNTTSVTVKNGSVKETPKPTAPEVSNNNAQTLKEGEKQNDQYEVAKKAKIDSLIENAIKAINREKWETALALYTEVLTLEPTPLQRNAINSEISVIKRNISKAGPKAPDASIAKTAYPTAKVPPPATIPNLTPKSGSLKPKDSSVVRSTNKNNSVTSTSIDASHMTAAASMPNTAESVAATDPGPSGAEMDTKKENVEFSKRLVSNPALSYLNDNNNEVKITCQSISSNDKNLFLKFLVQNNSAVTDFSIGSLQLTVIKNDGKLKKLHPKYITESAVVSPKKESSIVVVAENQTAIEANEAVVFEMEDQSKKTKLTVNISGNNFSGKNANQVKAF